MRLRNAILRYISDLPMRHILANDYPRDGRALLSHLRAQAQTPLTTSQVNSVNADIMVLTTIMLRPCPISEDKPFYGGAQRVHYIPMSWSHNRTDIKETEQDFVVWQNGGPTGDAGFLHDRIRELVEADAAPARKGDLRSIIEGKRARSRHDFLSIEKSN